VGSEDADVPRLAWSHEGHGISRLPWGTPMNGFLTEFSGLRHWLFRLQGPTPPAKWSSQPLRNFSGLTRSRPWISRSSANQNPQDSLDYLPHVQKQTCLLLRTPFLAWTPRVRPVRTWSAQVLRSCCRSRAALKSGHYTYWRKPLREYSCRFVSDALAIWREPYTSGLSLVTEAAELIEQGVHASKN
jgi:hypothetical protein